MQKNDLVKEIEDRRNELQEYIDEQIELVGAFPIPVVTLLDTLDTLQRAREALRWIPCEERLPEKSGNYRTTESIQPMGAEGFLYLLNFSYFDKTTKQWKGRGKIVAWMERPSPYTPEEK